MASLPGPQIFDWNRPFWEAAYRGEICLSRCASCGWCDGLPQIACSECHSFEREWWLSDGLGTVYSWTETNYAFHPDFTQMPMTIALVDLVDSPGVRLAGMVPVDGAAKRLEVGARVRCVFDSRRNAIDVPILNVYPTDQ